MTPAAAAAVGLAYMVAHALTAAHGGACWDRLAAWAHRQKETRHG